MNTPAEDPARNPFFRFSLKRSLGSGLFSIAGRMETNQRLVQDWPLSYPSYVKDRFWSFSLPHEGALWVPNFLSEENAGSPRWWFGKSKRTPDPRSLPLVKRNSKSKSIKKRYLGLRGSGWGSEGNRKTRNEVTRPGPIWVQIEEPETDCNCKSQL